MTTVYVVTAGSGDTYHIERIYLDGDEAYGFAQAYNGIAPVEPVQVEESQTGDPPAAYDGPIGARSGGRASRTASVAAQLRRHRRGANASTTSPSAKNGGPARSSRRPSWCAAN